ncbi:MAG: hypothetical protein IKI97_07135 [Clostridia bacterium]|nr:hypothetical protein [Clostridia bacterium]
MKSYEEMAEQVLKRSEKEIEKRNVRRRKTTRIVSSLSCFCIIAVICFSVYNNEIFDFGNNAGYQEQSIANTETGKKTNEKKELENYKYSINNSINKEQDVVAGTAFKPANGALSKEAGEEYDALDSTEKNAEIESISIITTEQAVKNAREMLSDKEIETIINLENPKIEEVILEGDTSIYLFDESFDTTEKSLYKITYNTELDGLLGPITFYVDKMSGIVIGADYRE